MIFFIAKNPQMPFLWSWQKSCDVWHLKEKGIKSKQVEPKQRSQMEAKQNFVRLRCRKRSIQVDLEREEEKSLVAGRTKWDSVLPSTSWPKTWDGKKKKTKLEWRPRLLSRSSFVFKKKETEVCKLIRYKKRTLSFSWWDYEMWSLIKSKEVRFVHNRH